MNTPTTAPSLYRAWRSRTFAEVVGQVHVTQTLRNAVMAGRVGHAYLFTGPRGTGKTSTARILARAVNCLDPEHGEPCNRCAICVSILEGRSLDLVEIDAASNNSVDDVRDLREKVNFAPTQMRRKVYIIDEVHMLSTSAFNALLKTLEEPPSHVLFVLATTDVHKVPATITSRCQRLDFRVIGLRDIVDRLAYVCTQEGLVADGPALELIAQQATGSLRDALSLLEQVRAYEGAAIGVEDVEEALGLARRETVSALVQHIIDGQAGAALVLVGDLAAAGADMRQYAKQVVQYWRDLLLLRSGGPAALGRAPDERLSAQAGGLTVAQITAVLRAILQPDYSGRRSASAQWQLELAVAEASQIFAARESTPAGPLPVQPQAMTEEQTEEVAARARAIVERVLGSSADSTVEKAPPAQQNGRGRPEAAIGPDSAALSLRQEPERNALAMEEPSAGTHDEGVTEEPSAGTHDEGAPTTGVGPGVEVERAWAQARVGLKSKARLHALLNGSCAPLRWEGDTLILGFKPDHTYHLGQIEQPQNRAAIEDALTRVVGRPVKVRCVTIERPAASAQDTPERDPFIDDAERLLRAVHMERRQP